MARTDENPTDAQIIEFLDEEVPGWRNLSVPEVRGELMKLMDDTLDTYNDLMRFRKEKEDQHESK